MKLESLIRLFDSPAVQLRSNYLQTLNIWTNIFGANQFLALSFDQLIDSDGLPKLLDFLQVSPNWGPTHDASAKILSSPNLKMPQELRWLCAAQFLPMVEQLVNIFPPSFKTLKDSLSTVISSSFDIECKKPSKQKNLQSHTVHVRRFQNNTH